MKSSITIVALVIYLIIVGVSCGSKANKDNTVNETNNLQNS